MTKISTLPQDSAPSSDDYIVVNDSTSGQTKKVLVSDLLSYVNTSGTPRAANTTNAYKFSVYRNAAWTTGSSASLIAFDTKIFDTGSNVDVVTNKGRFTAPVAGFYFFSTSVGSNTSNGGNNQQVLYLFVNGSNKHTLSNNFVPVVSSSQATHGSALVQLAANDYVEIYYQDTFATGGVTGSINTWFQGFLVSVS